MTGEVSGGESAKRAAAEHAVALVENGMRLGLGTGSTARHVLDVIGERRSRGELNDIIGVPTSNVTAAYAHGRDIPLGTLDDHPTLDLAIDGADEVDPALDLIKGLGGALLWEKIVASAAARFVIVVDTSKLVDRLGRRVPLPVEVVPFGWRAQLRRVEAIGCRATLREKHGQPFVTDGGHYILDCLFEDGIADAAAVEAALRARPGVVASGLFLGMATDVIVAGDGGVRHLRREAGQ
ncbi:MAG: ribose 5-phosphate isomerase A [Longimicrobiales bacterium]